jgi:hypothetical protein
VRGSAAMRTSDTAKLLVRQRVKPKSSRVRGAAEMTACVRSLYIVADVRRKDVPRIGADDP